MDFTIVEWFRFADKIPGLNIYMYVMVGCVIACAVDLFLLINFQFIHDWFDDLNEKYAQLVYEYTYSKNNKICVFVDHCRINRSGTYVSKPLMNVLDVKCSSNDDDRVLSITYKNDDIVEKEVVHCGQMGANEFYKVRNILMEV